MTSDEMPPRWMWHLDWELEIHFNRIDQAREDKYSGGSGGSSSSSDSIDDEPAVWDENVYASRFK